MTETKSARAQFSLLSKAMAKQSCFMTADQAMASIIKQMEANQTTLQQFHEGQMYRPLIIAGPSGVGKGTLIKRLTEQDFPDRFGFSVSYTTRKPRPGEVDGVHYNFVERSDFEQMVTDDKFIEHCEVHTNFYGTAKSQITKIQGEERIPLLDIDVQGALKFSKVFPNSNFVSILPPSIDNLRQRLLGRGTETEETLRTRLGNAQSEMDIIMGKGDIFQYRIINDDVDEAAKVLSNVVSALYSTELPEKSSSTAKPNVFFVLGGPGAGKGTQCSKLVADYGFVHLSAGDLLRAEIASGSEHGSMIQQIIDDGKIVPVAITCGLIKKAMQDNGWASSKFLVDGFPRNEDNRSGWYETMSESVDVAGVLHFACKDEAALTERIMERAQSSGRTDDNMETLQKRLHQYREEQLPVIAGFEADGKVWTINGQQEIDAVYSDVKNAIAAYI